MRKTFSSVIQYNSTKWKKKNTKQGKINTNADSKQWLKGNDSQIDKYYALKKWNGNFKNNNVAEIFNQDNTVTNEDKNDKETNNLFMWNSISFSQIKGYTRLNFCYK